VLSRSAGAVVNLTLPPPHRGGPTRGVLMIAPIRPVRSAIATRRASKRITNQSTRRCDWHEGFLRLLPNIRRQARRLLRGLTPQVREEAMDEVIAGSLVAYARLAELGTEDLAFASPLARFGVAQYRAGRRVGVRANVRDVLSHSCQQRNQLTIERLDRCDEASGSWQEVLVADSGFTPADAAATRIDFRNWLATLTERNRHLAEKLATGESTSGAARLFGMTSSRVSQLRRELHSAWEAFQGEFHEVTSGGSNCAKVIAG
jgi:hypothetical protein